MCCEEIGYMLSMSMNQRATKEMAKNYAVVSDPIKVYAPTPVIFGRPLGINYVSAGLVSPIESYLANIKIYQPIKYQAITEQPRIAEPIKTFSQLDVKRDMLFNELYKIKGGLYKNNLVSNYNNAKYN